MCMVKGTAAERPSLHKVKTEEITKICLFSPEI